MLTAILAKVLYVAAGAAVGWAAKHLHFSWLQYLRDSADPDMTPTDRPKPPPPPAA